MDRDTHTKPVTVCDLEKPYVLMVTFLSHMLKLPPNINFSLKHVTHHTHTYMHTVHHSFSVFECEINPSTTPGPKNMLKSNYLI